VRHRRPEQRHHRVADEFLDRAPEALQLEAQTGVVRREQRTHVLGVELLGARGEADKIGKKNRNDLALLAARRLLARERHTAGIAEPR